MEIWKDVSADLGQYAVSNLGNLRNTQTGKPKKTTIARNGYLVSNLWRNNKGAVVYLHHLIAEAFIGPRPEGAHINHIDGVKTNNSPENLEYVTPAENFRHAVEHGFFDNRGVKHANSRLTDSDVREIRSRLSDGERGKDLAKEFGIAASTLSQIKTGARWAHIS